MRARTRSRLTAGSVVLALAIGTVGMYEGLRTKAYRDVVGIPTICFGETRGVRMGDERTVAECKAMLAGALEDFEKEGILRCVNDPAAIPDKSYVAFLSLSYNIGTGAFCKSTLVRKLNRSDLPGACDQILRWDRAGGRRIRGLTLRRIEEHDMCLEGVGEGR